MNYYRGAGALCRKAALVRTLRRCDNEGTLHRPLDQWLPHSFVIRPCAPASSAPAMAVFEVKSNGADEREVSEIRHEGDEEVAESEDAALRNGGAAENMAQQDKRNAASAVDEDDTVWFFRASLGAVCVLLRRESNVVQTCKPTRR